MGAAEGVAQLRESRQYACVRGRRVFLGIPFVLATLGVVACGGTDQSGSAQATASGTSSQPHGSRVWRDARLGDKRGEVVLGFTGPDPSAGASCVESYTPQVVTLESGIHEIFINVPLPMAKATCPMKRVEVSVELNSLREGDVIEAGSSSYRYRLTDGRFELQPESTPCGRVDCSTPSPTPAPCRAASFQEAIARDIDSSIRITGNPRCDGSFLIVGIDTGSGRCAPTEGAASPCAKPKTAYFVARDGKWSLVTYAAALTCAEVAAMTAVRFPASLCH